MDGRLFAVVKSINSLKSEQTIPSVAEHRYSISDLINKYERESLRN